MNVEYSDKAKQSNQDHALLQQATQYLQEVPGASAETIKGEWDRTQDAKGRPLYTLRISDWSATATASFAPDELSNPHHMIFRMNDLWGDLLQARNHKQLQALLNTDARGS
jgi:hypothetical protein